MVTAEHDPLRDEGFAYADRLRAARVPVEHRHYGSQIHAFFTFTGVLDDADKAVSEAGSAIRSAVDAPRLSQDVDAGHIGAPSVHHVPELEEGAMRANAAVFEKLFTPLSVTEVEIDAPRARRGAGEDRRVGGVPHRRARPGR